MLFRDLLSAFLCLFYRHLSWGRFFNLKCERECREQRGVNFALSSEIGFAGNSVKGCRWELEWFNLIFPWNLWSKNVCMIRLVQSRWWRFRGKNKLKDHMKKMLERKKQTEMSLTKQCTIILVVAVVAFGGGGTNCSQKTWKQTWMQK